METQLLERLSAVEHAQHELSLRLARLEGFVKGMSIGAALRSAPVPIKLPDASETDPKTNDTAAV